VGKVTPTVKSEGGGCKSPFITRIQPVSIRQQTRIMPAECYSSDLQQVETKAERAQAAMAAADDGAPKRVKRVRPPIDPVANEPLQQVETRN
jgi:hypothetical protein